MIDWNADLYIEGRKIRYIIQADNYLCKVTDCSRVVKIGSELFLANDRGEVFKIAAIKSTDMKISNKLPEKWYILCYDKDTILGKEYFSTKGDTIDYLLRNPKVSFIGVFESTSKTFISERELHY